MITIDRQEYVWNKIDHGVNEQRSSTTTSNQWPTMTRPTNVWWLIIIHSYMPTVHSKWRTNKNRTVQRAPSTCLIDPTSTTACWLVHAKACKYVVPWPILSYGHFVGKPNSYGGTPFTNYHEGSKWCKYPICLVSMVFFPSRSSTENRSKQTLPWLQNMDPMVPKKQDSIAPDLHE